MLGLNVGGKGTRGFAACRVAYLFDGSPSDEEGPVVFLAPREGRREDAIRENSAEADEVHEDQGVGGIFVNHLAKSAQALELVIALDAFVA